MAASVKAVNYSRKKNLSQTYERQGPKTNSTQFTNN